ncbi:MAG: hypothetical protein U5N86_06530 [Planctomycetota bacterium]|nr:hypothetical protein [Planctomycetota bacterium]
MNFRDNSGTVFVLAMIMIVLCSGLLVAIFTTAMTDVKQSDIERRRTFAFTCADSGVEYAAVMLRTAAANLVTPPSSGTLTINGIDVDWEIAAAQDESGNDLVRNTISGDDFHTLSKLYHITAICTFENTYARSQQYISLDSMPIFQFFAFYENDLEILPGPEMHVRGRVHSNSDLYLGSENRIYYEKGRIRSAGDLWRHRKDRDSYPSGTVYVSPDNTPMYTNEDSDWTGTYDGTSIDFAQMALSKWDRFVMTGDHGVSKIRAARGRHN